MEKLSHTEVTGILSQVGPTLRAQQAEIEALREKVATYEKRDRVTKLASEMQAKDLDPDTSLEEKVDRLMESPESDLVVIEKAVGLSAPQLKLAHIADRSGHAADPASEFEAQILE